jgi:hypothetical protein
MVNKPISNKPAKAWGRVYKKINFHTQNYNIKIRYAPFVSEGFNFASKAYGIL